MENRWDNPGLYAQPNKLEEIRTMTVDAFVAKKEESGDGTAAMAESIWEREENAPIHQHSIYKIIFVCELIRLRASQVFVNHLDCQTRRVAECDV